MPAADFIHDSVKNALIKDGWSITADPYVIEYEDVRLFADLSAERPLAAQRGQCQYLLLSIGWRGDQRVHSVPVYVRLKDRQVWIEDDWTDLVIADRLIAAANS